MTTSALDILVRARDEASSTLRGVSSETSRLGTTTAHTSTTMSKGFDSAKGHLSSLLKFGAGAIGVVGVEQFASKALEAFDALEKSEHRLEYGLQAIGQGAAATGIEDWSKSFSVQTGIAQQDIVDVSSKLAVFGKTFLQNAGPQASADLEKLSGGFENMAAATGKSVSMLMRSLGPAILNTPAAATTVMQKFGVITSDTANQVKALGDTTNTSLNSLVTSGAITQEYADHVLSLSDAQRKQQASQIEINALQTKYAGAAAATATPLEKLKNLFNQLELGAGKFISAGLGWLLNVGFPALKKWVLQVWTAAKPFINILAQAARQMLPQLKDAFMTILPSLKNLWNAIKPIVIVLAGGLFLAILGLIKVLPILVKAISILDSIIYDLVALIIKGLVGAFKIILAIAKPIFRTLFDVIAGPVKATIAVWKGIVGVFRAVWQGVKAIIMGVVNWIAGKLKWIWDKALAVYHFVQKIPGVGALTGGGGGLAGIASTVGHVFSAIPGLASGGVVERTGLAIVHEGEQFSGVGKKFGAGTVHVNINRRQFVDESDYDIRYRGW